MASSPSYAFVTLLTSDSYLPGALTLVAALHDVHATVPTPPFKTVCLITPETISADARKAVMNAFDLVVGVDVIREDTAKGLNLLGRPDLQLVLTKLHVFRLTQFDKVIFLDADILPIRPISHLFSLPHEFSAVPDVGWPDIFNSGFMVFQPGEDQFKQVMNLVRASGSWDGGDQGILNEWRGENWHRLSFTYNTTPTAAYTYAPAYERFGSEIRAIHFIGTNKPWKNLPWRAPGAASAVSATSLPSEDVATLLVQPAYAYSNLVDKWFSVYDAHYRPSVPSEAQKRAMRVVDIPKYAAAWDQASRKVGRPTQAPTASDVSAIGRASKPQGGATMGVDQLRLLGSGGWAAVASQRLQGGPSPTATVKVTVARGLPDMGLGYVGPASEHGEAQYISMPLDPHNQLKPIQEESVLYAYPFELVPSEPHQSSLRPPEKFVEPPDWAPPATATSEPPPHLFRSAPADPALPGGPRTEQEPHRAHTHQSSWHPPSRPSLHPRRHSSSHQPVGSFLGKVQPVPSPSFKSVSGPHHRPQHPRSGQKSSHQQSRSLGDKAPVPSTSDDQPVTPAFWRRLGGQQRPPSPPRDAATTSSGFKQTTSGPVSASHHRDHRHAHSHHHAQQQHYHRHFHHSTHPPLPERRVSPSQSPAQPRAPDKVTLSASTSFPLPSPENQVYFPPQPPRQPYFRPVSPGVHFEAPLETWNPAKEPPPNTLPAGAYNQPITTAVKNVWDLPRHHPQRQAHSQRDQQYELRPPWLHPEYSTSDHSPAPPIPDTYPEDFFVPPTPPSIPSQLLRDGHYQAIISSNPEPDSSKVTSVFPWETERRPPPGRVFPSADAPPPIITSLPFAPSTTSRTRQPDKSAMIVTDVMTPSPTTVASVASPILRPASPKPKHVTRAYSYDWRSEAPVFGAGVDPQRGMRANAWDTVPSIARYAKRLAEPAPGPSSVKPKDIPGSDKDWPEGFEESDAASHEADDEDDESDDDRRQGSGTVTPVGRPGKRPHGKGGSGGRGTGTPKHVEKGVGTTYSSKGIGTLQYRSQSVQTVPKSTQSRGVQVNRTSYSRYRAGSSASSSSPMDRSISLPADAPTEAPPARRTRSTGAAAVTFAPTPPDLHSRRGSPTASPPSGGVTSPRMDEGPSFMAFRERLRSQGNAPSPTITTPAAEGFSQTPFPRTSVISTGSSNRNSAAFSVGTNRDSTYTDTQTTPRSSVILSPIAATTLPPHVRTSSNETAVTGRTTPPSSIPPESPDDDPASRARRNTGRHWDSRRDVDIFKSQSQDVLARFLKMGGWEEDQKKKEIRS